MEVIDGVVGLIAAVHVDLGQGDGVRPDVVSAVACCLLLVEQVVVRVIGEFGCACCLDFSRRRAQINDSDSIDSLILQRVIFVMLIKKQEDLYFPFG
jgi:hypothetical protein